MVDTAPCTHASEVVVIGPSLGDRVSFSQAQGILVGLTSCTPDRAAHALLNAALDLGITVGEVARRLTRCMTTDDDRLGPVMARLAAATLGPEPKGIPGDTPFLDAQPQRGARPQGAGGTDPRARPDMPAQGARSRIGLPSRKATMSSTASPKNTR